MSVKINTDESGETQDYYQSKYYHEAFSAENFKKLLNLPAAVFDASGDSMSDAYPRMLFTLENSVKMFKNN